MFKTYDKNIKEILSAKAPDMNWGNILEYHKIMLARIQHERLMHLLVMMFVGIIMSCSVFFTIVTTKPDLLIFGIPLFFLFIAYIFHYRFLENTTQNWYLLEDQIKTFTKKDSRE